MTTILDLIGETPLVEVTRIDCGPCRLFLKMESANPSGSLKDRPARTMIEAAEADGRLKPGGTIVEATAGNTGLGLALVGGRKGYRTVLVVPDKMAREKVLHARAMGAEVVVTRSDVGKGHPDYYQDLAAAITARTPGAFFTDQFGNPANPRTHETDDRPGNPAADGGCGRRRRHGRGLGRHADRHRPLHEIRVAGDADDSRRSGRFDPGAAGTDRTRSRSAEAGRSKASARTSCRRIAICRWCRPRIRFPIRRASRRRAISCGGKAFSPAPPPARCWRRRCATAVNRRSRGGW